MRKVRLQMQISLDGFVARPNGEMDFITWTWDDKITEYVNDLTDASGTIVMGRKMTDGFMKHWTAEAAHPTDPSRPFAQKMLDIPKVVFTKTLTASEWPNTTLATGDIADEIAKLKNQPGKDIIVYGGAGLASSLIAAGLIDEYYFYVNPCIIGKGMAIFNAVENTQQLTLAKATPFECGITAMHFTRNK